ncbi:MAG TPA: MerR family transcriptional regulator [Gammaproteobacteria bacterium]|nr:MerR family transcriptional regulator [Gammaproteobacteria bacterium]
MINEPANPCYSISAVSEMTGVNPSTLRAWERRYGLLQPQRSEGGQRLYTTHDVDRVRRILACLDEGVMLSQVEAVLNEMPRRPDESGQEEWHRLRSDMIAAIKAFNETGIDAVYGEALALHPFAEVTEMLTVPVLEYLGRCWENGEGLVAEEHFFQMYVRNVLGARFFHRHRATHGRLLVAACVPGEQHDLGLLLFCLAAEAEGFRTINLGANTPLEELPQVAGRAGASAIVLAAGYGGIGADLAGRLRTLVTSEAGPVVLVGGRRVEAERQVIEDTGAHILGADIRDGIRRLWQMLG